MKSIIVSLGMALAASPALAGHAERPVDEQAEVEKVSLATLTHVLCPELAFNMRMLGFFVDYYDVLQGGRNFDRFMQATARAIEQVHDLSPAMVCLKGWQLYGPLGSVFPNMVTLR